MTNDAKPYTSQEVNETPLAQLGRKRLQVTLAALEKAEAERDEAVEGEKSAVAQRLTEARRADVMAARADRLWRERDAARAEAARLLGLLQHAANLVDSSRVAWSAWIEDAAPALVASPPRPKETP